MFPELDGDDFKKLALDVKANGLRQPITTFEGMVLDGQNRLNACIANKIEPDFVELEKGIDPLDFVISQNMNRRHLTDDQRAMIAAEIAKAKPGKSNSADPALLKPKTVSDAAEKMKVTPRQVKRAKTVAKRSPSLAKAVKNGKISLNEAAEQVTIHQPKPEPQTDAQRFAAVAAGYAPNLPEDGPVEPPDPTPAAITTLADAIAFVDASESTIVEEWEAAALILRKEVKDQAAKLALAQKNLEIAMEASAAPMSGPLTPAKLLAELRKFASLIPDTLPQMERDKYGHAINKMVQWLMNPVQPAGTPSPYTR